MDPSSYAVEQSLGGNLAQRSKRKTKIYVVIQKKKMSWHEVSDADYRGRKCRIYHCYHSMIIVTIQNCSFSSAYLFSGNDRPGKLTNIDAISHIYCYLFSGINTSSK